MRFIVTLCLLSYLMAVSGEAQEIVDMFSNLESCDVTVKGPLEEGDKLHVDLIYQGEAMQTRVLPLRGAGLYVVQWDSIEGKEENYQACASIIGDNKKAQTRCYSFLNAARVPVRFDVRDFLADSRGIHMTLFAEDPTIVNIDYSLISNNKSLYTTEGKGISLAGGMLTPLQMSYEWKQLLNESQTYSGRVKISEINYGHNRALMGTFEAQEDASITETYEDEMGASATIMGESRVPLQGSLRFLLSQNGSILADVQKKTPILSSGDDETVEISWNETLKPGIYRLKVVLMGRGGEVLDEKESVIEAKELARLPEPVQEPAKSPALPIISAMGALWLVYAWRRRFC